MAIAGADGVRGPASDAALAVLSNLPDVLITCDAEGVVEWASPSVETMLGYRPGDLVGTYLRLTPEGDRDSVLQEFGGAARSGAEVVRSRRQLLRADGSLVWADLAARFVRGDDGRVVRTIASIRDVGDLVRRERNARAAEDHAVMSVVISMEEGPARRALAMQLGSRGVQVTTVAEDADALAARVAGEQPDACLVDPSLFLGGVVRPLQRVVAAAAPAPVVVVIDAHDRSAFVSAVTQGARGVLLRDRPQDVHRALQAAVAGEVAVPRPLTGILVSALRAHDMVEHGEGLLAQLTEREREILDLVAQGLSTRQIAAELVVAPVTVRSHIASGMHKLQVHDRDEAAALVRRLSLGASTDTPR